MSKIQTHHDKYEDLTTYGHANAINEPGRTE